MRSVPDHIVVVAAVIERDGRFLVARRLKGTHLAGYWEFPGGKVQDGEAHEEALRREIAEELSTGISDVRKIFHTAHTYAERVVELHFYRGELAGDPQPVLGQELRWITRAEFGSLEFPPADAELIDGLIHASL
jgi:mutator protein MutT